MDRLAAGAGLRGAVGHPLRLRLAHRGPDYEDGAAHPRPLRYPAEVDDIAFLIGQPIDYIRSASGPFIAHLSLLRPHPPFVAPEPYNAMYDPAQVPGFTRLATPEDEARQHPWLAYQLARRVYRATDNEKRLRRLKAVYYGLMSRVDAELGRLIRFLKESGRWDSTLIIFTSDHGEQIGDHWLIGKCGYFDGSYHIPLIIRDPRAQADAERGAVVSSLHRERRHHADDARGDRRRNSAAMRRRVARAVPRGRGPSRQWRTEAHWEFDFRDPADDSAERALGLTMHQCALNIVRGERYKYVHFTNLPPLFFDLQKDPNEFTNLASDAECAPMVLEYAQKLLSWRMNHDEQTLTHITLRDDGPITRRAPRY